VNSVKGNLVNDHANNRSLVRRMQSNSSRVQPILRPFKLWTLATALQVSVMRLTSWTEAKWAIESSEYAVPHILANSLLAS
jgi:hypothetical protein